MPCLVELLICDYMFVFIDSYFRDSIKKDGSILLMNTFVGTYFDSLH